ncbi:DNA-J related domain-containing protein [Pokkaliibacter sp. CJK22405]|uniref:DNA-J related domain-containing protein n=1 Tax=Pokkaliibacter sp. CJK22405 TaxID=3384615 RepID=UPI003984EE19
MDDIYYLPLRDALTELLQSGNRYTEFALIAALRERGFDLPLSPALALFQTHFALFHTLYRLSDEMLNQHQAHLSIHTLCIEYQSLTHQQNAISQTDKLREYYLDWETHFHTQQADVEALLSTAFSQFFRHEKPAMAIEEALSTLKLPIEQPQSSARPEYLKQYRRLIQQAHPDKGGDAEHFHQLQQAWKTLEHHLFEH